MLGDISAENLHDLSKCIDAKAMVLCAEIFFRASLLRKESRGFHYREDYPDQNGEWMKWLVIQEKNGQMSFSAEKVPREEYDY